MNDILQPVKLRPGAGFMWRHPGHLLALGFGSGLSPKGPGTAGTLWAWAAFVALQPWVDETTWGWVIAAGIPLGIWACAVTARDLGVADPSAVVWDEVVAFWLVLWLVMPTGWQGQLAAFALFRFFDIAKPGPVGWADNLFHGENPATTPWHHVNTELRIDEDGKIKKWMIDWQRVGEYFKAVFTGKTAKDHMTSNYISALNKWNP